MTREDIEKKMREAAEEIKPLVTTLVEALCGAHQKGYLAGVELGAKMAYPHWIPVEEELPDVDEQTTLSNECVVVDSAGARYFGYYNGTDECWYTDDYTMILFVTHWMPLPEAPRKEANDE